MKLAVALQLGRISNLPTVWSNVLVGVALAGGALNDTRLPLLLVAMSLFYVAGMFLNDAFDREFDARARPERPIPSGATSATQVFGFGFGMLAVGLALLLHIGYGFDPRTGMAPCAGGYRARGCHRVLRPLAQGQPAQSARDGRVPHAGLCHCGIRGRCESCRPACISPRPCCCAI